MWAQTLPGITIAPAQSIRRTGLPASGPPSPPPAPVGGPTRTIRSPSTTMSAASTLAGSSRSDDVPPARTNVIAGLPRRVRPERTAPCVIGPIGFVVGRRPGQARQRRPARRRSRASAGVVRRTAVEGVERRRRPQPPSGRGPPRRHPWRRAGPRAAAPPPGCTRPAACRRRDDPERLERRRYRHAVLDARAPRSGPCRAPCGRRPRPGPRGRRVDGPAHVLGGDDALSRPSSSRITTWVAQP